MEMKISEGYKKTEVGVIPVDWELVHIGDILQVAAGFAFSSLRFKKHGVPVIRISDIYGGKVTSINSVCYDQEPMLENFTIKQNDVLIAMSGATTGKVGIYTSANNAYQNQRVGKFVVKNNAICSSKIVPFIISSYVFKQALAKELVQGAQPNISGRQIESLIIPFPKKKFEQQAIATALSDVDSLISSLEQLIEKKEDIKQGAMQELLTGKKRLAEFGKRKVYKQTEVGEIPEDWEVIKFENTCSRSKERLLPIQLDKEFKCIELEHLSQGSGRLLGYSSSKNVKSQKAFFNKGDILFGKLRPYLRKYLYAQFEGICSTEIWVLKASKSIDNKYLYYLVQSKSIIEAANQSEGTKMPRANWNVLKNLNLPIPSKKEEQFSIASVLSDMDSEIDSLERKLDKYKQVRQGIMQNLLTGKIRLV